MRATMSRLSMDLIEEIISRIPLKYMGAVRLTCKKWEALSKSRVFTKLHIGRLGEAREGESRVVVMMDHNLHSVSVAVEDDDDPPSTERNGELACRNDSGEAIRIRFTQVSHCDGLLLCILKDDDTRVVVWNPYWGQTRWIQPRSSYRPYGRDVSTYALGYENKKSGRRHKLLRFIDARFPTPPGNRVTVCEIYDFDSDLWKTLAVDPPHWCVLWWSLSVSLKGNTYWGATKGNKSWPSKSVDHMICFDFTRESFGPLLPLPSSPRNSFGGRVTLSCVREEKLAALFYHGEPSEIEIWITAKIEAGKEISWSKLLTVVPLVPIGASFFIDEVKKVVLIFDRRLGRDSVTIIGYSGSVRVVDLGKPGSARVVDLGEPADTNALTLASPYVPSSVQLKQPARPQRKRRGSRLVNQRMLERFAVTGKRFKTATPATMREPARG